MDEELLKAIEAEGWSVRPSIQDGKHIVDIAVFSPAGEDFCPTIWYGDGSAQEFVEELGEYIDGYDVDEETYLWLGQMVMARMALHITSKTFWQTKNGVSVK